MKRFLAFALVMALVVGLLVGCGQSPAELLAALEGLQEVDPGYTADPNGTTGNPWWQNDPPATEPSTVEPPTMGPVVTPTEGPAVEGVLVYTLTPEDLERFDAACQRLLEITRSSRDPKEVEDAYYQAEDLYNFISDQQSVAFILYCCDESDEELKNRHLEATQMQSDAYNIMMEVLKAAFFSDGPQKDVLFEGWTEAELHALMNYTQEVAQLELANEELLVQYRDLDDGDFDQGTAAIYGKLIANNNRIADIYGYENYYDYAYEVAYGRDYGGEAVEYAKKLAQAYLVDGVVDALDHFSTKFQNLSANQQMLLINFMDSDYEDLTEDYLQMYIDSRQSPLPEDMVYMFESGRVIFTDHSDAREGAFTTSIGGEPFCYFGPGYQNTLTLVHELGHFTGARHVELDLLPLDLAELQSQGNEWRMMAWMKQVLDGDTYECLLAYRAYTDMASILISFMVDEFERQIYMDPNSAGYSLADFEEVASRVCEDYGGEAFLRNNVTDFQDYWKLVVLEQPVYYISYAVSDLAAISLYTVAVEDEALGDKLYTALTVDADPTLGFLGNLELAGLQGPFDEEVYRRLAALFD